MSHKSKAHLFTVAVCSAGCRKAALQWLVLPAAALHLCLSACVFAGDRGANPGQHRWWHHSVVMLWNHWPASHPPFCCRGLYFEVMGWRCRSQHRVMWGQGLYFLCVSVGACRAECLQLHYDLELCHLGAATDANALRSQRREWQTRLNMQIQNISLELVVNIFR